MKKMLILMLCIGLIPALYANTDRAPQTLPDLKAPYTTNFVMPVREGRLDILWAQYPNPATAIGMACQHAPTYPFDAWLLDDVIPPTDDFNVDSVVTWWANWNAFVSWSLVPEIYFQVYEDSGLAYAFPKIMPSQEVTVDQADFTATTIGTDQYMVEMVLPSTVTLPAGEISWICVQPNSDFPANGQTGWMGEVGIGNGQECYFAFPLLGNDKWVTATSVFGTPNEAGFVLLGTEGGGAEITWDFETGWQDWTHTNGQVFPAAWGVEPSGIHTPCPDPGDSSMWIDSDASGGGYSDSALSPLLVPNPTMDWLTYGYYNYGGGTSYVNELRVGIKHFTGGVWNVVELAYYPTGTTSGPAWDSVDVSPYVTADQIQIYFYHDDLGTWGYYSAFDNVTIDATIYTPSSDVGCTAVLSPPEGSTPPGDYDVIGRIQNFGSSIETFDVTANVYDTVGMGSVFSQTVTLTDFPVSGDSNVNFGQVTFEDNSHYYTVIFTELVGDVNPANDTSSIYSTTAISPGDIVFELDVEAITGDIRLLGVEFDGEYFYITGATDMTQTMVYIVDTAGTLMHSDIQPAHSTSWGWRDIAWDYAYRGPDRIDTLYSSVDGNVDKWSYDFIGDSLIYHGYFDGPELPNRGLAYDGDDDWFFTANFSSPCYKFDKTNSNIQSVANTWAVYGAAYDAGHPTTDGPWVWWHSQDDLGGTGYLLTIHQMEPQTMVFTGYFLAPVPTMSAVGTAGGLCYWSDFRGMDVLFGMNQGTPDHIFGVFVRTTPTGIEEEPGVGTTSAFGFAPMANPTRDYATISYAITKPGMVSLKVYDGTGRLVETLVNNTQEAGIQTVTWDAQNISNGVYFLKLEAENQTAVRKLILVK